MSQHFPTFSPDGTMIQNRPRKRKYMRAFFLVLSLTAISTLSGYIFSVGMIVQQTRNTLSSIVVNGGDSQASLLGITKTILSEQPTAPLKGEEDKRINILLLGKASEDYPSGKDLTDTIMVASIDMETKKVSFLSLPRDLSIPIPGMTLETKINALYAMGKDRDDPFSIIREGVSSLLDLPIHYCFMVDYKAFVQVVDAIGGIHVMVERDILDTRFPGPNYSYQTFELKKGLHHLDGATALKYVRERHSDPMGDFGRAKRQQQTLKAIKTKIWNAKIFLNPLSITELLHALEGTLKMDMPLEEIPRVLELSETLDLENIEMIVLDAWRSESLLRVSHIYLANGQRMFALTPRTGNFDEIRSVAKNIFDTSYLQNRKENIQKEEPTVLIMTDSERFKTARDIQKLLEQLGFSDITLTRISSSQEIPEYSLIKDSTDLKKPFSLDELIKTLPGKIAPETIETEEEISSNNGEKNNSDEEPYDFIVQLGEDAYKRHVWEEASKEEFEQSATDEDRMISL